MNDAAETNYNTDYDKDRKKQTMYGYSYIYIMIEIIIIYQPVTVQKRLNHRESSVGKLNDTST